MNEQKRNIENDDVEGHRIPTHLNDSPEALKHLEGDDVEGHRLRADRKRADVDLGDDDDVEGHRISVQPPRDADNSGNQF
jgi:hypothetical protein